MNAKLEFNLPDEQYEYKCATSGQDYKLILEDICQELRKTYKYLYDDIEGLSSEEGKQKMIENSAKRQYAEQLKTTILEMIQERGVFWNY